MKSIVRIFWIGLIAGTLDITENLVFNLARGITPWRVFQYVASGLIGTRAFHAGWASVGLGAAVHYAIALIWTSLFYVACLRAPIIMRRPILSGLIYGGLVYLIMNFIALPLSGVPQTRNAMTLASRINDVLALLLCIGLPISLFVQNVLAKDAAAHSYH